MTPSPCLVPGEDFLSVFTAACLWWGFSILLSLWSWVETRDEARLFVEFPCVMFSWLCFFFTRYWKKNMGSLYRQQILQCASGRCGLKIRAMSGAVVTLEGVDRNAAALSELSGKYWLRIHFFVLREKSIIQSPWVVFFSLLGGFQLCETGLDRPPLPAKKKKVNT